MSCSDGFGLSQDDWDCLEEKVTETLKLHFMIAAIVISAALFLAIVLLVILYAWVYKLNKKLQDSAQNNLSDFKIRRAQIRGQDFPPQAELPRLQSMPQNPLSRSGNYNSVVEDLSKRSTNQPNSQQPRYPNYVNDNSNFAY